MEFAGTFLPTAGVVGLLPVVTWFFLTVTFYAFVGNFIFALRSRNSLAPEHRVSLDYTAVIAAVAGISYYLIQEYYRDMLGELAKLNTEGERLSLIRASYNAIGQLRYMDWAITTPLLLLKMVSMLKIHYRNARSAVHTLIAADFFMILTGYIGEQQLGPNNEILVVSKLVWGAISTIGYLIVLVVLLRLWRQHKDHVRPEERRGYRLLALMTVTFWGVYPIGYILTTINGFDLNWIHIAFSVADVINKVGATVISFQVAEAILEQRLPEEATAPYHSVD